MAPFRTTYGHVDVLLFIIAPLKDDGSENATEAFVSDTTELKEFELESDGSAGNDEIFEDNQSVDSSCVNPHQQSDVTASLREHKTPRSLRCLLQVIILAFVTMIVVGTVYVLLN